MWNKLLFRIGLPLLLICSFFFRLSALQQTPYTNGWDSYFYLIQLKALLEEGQMHSPDVSLIYPFMALIQWTIGDYVLTFKVSAALLSMIFTGLVFALAFRLTKSILMAFLLGAFTVYSPHLTFFTAQYPKNLLGLILFLSFLWSIAERRWNWSFFILGLNYFGHRLTMGLSLLTGLAFLFFEKTSQYFRLKQHYIIGGLTLLVLVGASFLLPGLLNLADIERFQGLMTSKAHFAPISFWQMMESGQRLSVWWKVEIIISTGALLIGFYLLLTNSSALAKAYTCILFLLLFPYFEWSLTGMAYRFYLVAVLLSPLLICFLSKQIFRYKILPLALSILLLILGFFSYQSYQPDKHDANYALYDSITQKTVQQMPVQPELLIAHNGLAEYFTFTTGIDAMPWLSEYPISEDKLWRIATDIRAVELKALLKDQQDVPFFRLGVNYYLLPEKNWQQLLHQLEVQQDTVLLNQLDTWRNPNRIRPAFLLKKKENRTTK